MQTDHGNGVTARAAEPRGELAESIEFESAWEELRLYRNGESFSLWLVEPLEEGQADLYLQGDYPARIWQGQAEAIARADLERLADQIRANEGAGRLRVFDEEDRVNVATWAGVHPDAMPPL